MTSDRLPASYRARSGCHDCAYCFLYEEYDEGSTYYCVHGAPKRPPCLSVLMGEFDEDAPYDEYHDQRRRWREWSAGREVRPWGWCEGWASKEADAKSAAERTG